MNRNNVLNYASEIPEEIKSVIKGLDSDVRIAIIVILMKDAKLTFSELKQRLSLNSSSLSSHLSALQDGGLVNNFLEWNEKSYSYYMITDIAKAVLESLFDIVTQTGGFTSFSDLPNQDLEQQIFSDERTKLQSDKYLELALEGGLANDAIESIPIYAKSNPRHERDR
jgi:DNA-binding transcriptional ArsR family regulator